jgi:hypothetical protein
MLIRVYLGLLLLSAIPGRSQLNSVPFEMSSTSREDVRMLTPPPVSNQNYPTLVGSEARSNYIGAGVVFSAAYNDNVLAGGNNMPIHDLTYSLWPTIELDQTSTRQHRKLTYSPGFTLYQHTSALNAIDQHALMDFEYRLSEHATITFSDDFEQSSNVFSQSLAGAISGSPLSLPPGVLAPFATRITNSANIGLSYQFDRNSMIGASGIGTASHYPNPAQALGINDSNSRGGSAFYCRRLSSTQYIGLTYQYLDSQSNPANAQSSPLNRAIDVQTHTILPFYTLYFSPTLSLSLSAGPQYVGSSQQGSPTFLSWAPTVMMSMARQTARTNFVASYSRTITGGSGLLGTFSSDSVNGALRLQAARTWTMGSAVIYRNDRNITPHFSSSNPGGHTITGTVSLKRSMSGHLDVVVGYDRLHQSYSGVAALSSNPDSNREFISISYLFTRALGR